MDGVPVIQTSKTCKRVTLSANGSLILLSDDQQCNYASVAVRMILRNLATVNGRDADLFQRAFDDLVAYVQNSENALSIQVELLEARIHHINRVTSCMSCGCRVGSWTDCLQWFMPSCPLRPVHQLHINIGRCCRRKSGRSWRRCSLWT
ncbi:uncharacterized protein LOC125304903 isoform X3 [Alosa alosa]|uniref:uncharacterized protein LOC125304903 isoform X3 n=1 Tax=Alosa alosa TaxID=278164 RepID=UPI0020155217|nr:uncharacterized protein LOC125304903 isoform X3 [Alosa alosa]